MFYDWLAGKRATSHITYTFRHDAFTAEENIPETWIGGIKHAAAVGQDTVKVQSNELKRIYSHAYIKCHMYPKLAKTFRGDKKGV